MVKGISDKILVMIQPCWRFALSDCLEYDDCVWIFGGEAASPDGYLNEYGDFIFSYLNSLTEKKCYRD